MKKRKETINREITESENGFKIIKERTGHTIEEDGKKVGVGAKINSVSKIITPNGEELENMKEVFDWLAENHEYNQKISVDFEPDKTKVSKRVGRQN